MLTRFESMRITSKIYLLLCFMVVCHFSLSDDSNEEEEEKEEPAFGGVRIKVFRGPSKKKGRETFAPFGYYVTMPVDSHQKKGSSEEKEDDDESEEFQFDDEKPNDSEEDF